MSDPVSTVRHHTISTLPISASSATASKGGGTLKRRRASRELTEGFGSLFAAIILRPVGIWMHGKSNAEAWQRYIKEKMTHALSRRSGWFLFLLAFVVYREVFETVLFYAALWAQGDGLAMLGGAAAAKAGGEVHIADYGLQRTPLMRALFRAIIQNLDGRVNTEPNARGVLSDRMREAGFRSVEETLVIRTLSGSLSLYRGVRA